MIMKTIILMGVVCICSATSFSQQTSGSNRKVPVSEEHSAVGTPAEESPATAVPLKSTRKTIQVQQTESKENTGSTSEKKPSAISSKRQQAE